MDTATQAAKLREEHAPADDGARRNQFGGMIGAGRSLWAKVPARDLLLLAALVILAIKVNWGLNNFRDVKITDESYYLEHGLQWNLPGASMSPLYCAWYAALSQIVSDPIVLYYGNWVLMSLALAVGVYLLSRSLGAASLPAFLSASVILLTRFYEVAPRPMHCAASLVMIGLAIAFAFRSLAARLSVATLTLGVASFVRPGFAVAFLALATVLCGVLIWEGWKRPELTARLTGWGMLAILPVLLLCQTFGFPLGGGRSDIAFSQHYSYAKFQAGLIDTEALPDWLGPWHSYRKIVEEDFGVPVVGISEALATAPWKVAGHVGRSIRAFVPNSAAILTGSTPLVTALVWGYLFVLACGALRCGMTCFRTTPIRNLIGRAGGPLLIGLIVIAPIVVACLVIYPREHYLVCLLTVPLAYVTAFSSMARVSLGWGKLSRLNGIWRRPRSVAIVAGLVVLLAPHNFVHWQVDALFSQEKLAEATPFRRNVTIAGRLREIPFRKPLRILESRPHSIFMFTDHEYRSIRPRHIGEAGFADFLRREHINVVILRSNNAKHIAGLRDDPDYKTFQSNPPPGWVLVDIRGRHMRLAIHRQALAGPIKRPEGIATVPIRNAHL